MGKSLEMSSSISVFCTCMASSCAAHNSARGIDNFPFKVVFFGSTFEFPHTNETCICPFEVSVRRYMA